MYYQYITFICKIYRHINDLYGLGVVTVPQRKGFLTNACVVIFEMCFISQKASENASSRLPNMPFSNISKIIFLCHTLSKDVEIIK